MAPDLQGASASGSAVRGAENEENVQIAMAGFDRQSGNFWQKIIYEDSSFKLEDLSKEDLAKSKKILDRQFSLSRVAQGRNRYPFSPLGIQQSIVANPYHQTCLSAKVNATLGVGFLSDDERKNGPTSINSSQVAGNVDVNGLAQSNLLNPAYLPSEVDKKMNPLCEVSWQDTLMSAGHDFFRSGNGYIEIARDPKNPYTGKITNVWHLPWYELNAYIESSINLRNWHWVQSSYDSPSSENVTAPGTTRYARFGDKKSFMERTAKGLPLEDAGILEDPLEINSLESGYVQGEGGDIHEILHIRNPYSMHRIYGYPDWLSAIPAIEIIQALMQYKLDFFVNRGVPEYMLFITGQKLSKGDWAKVESKIQAATGSGNAHKSFAINLDNKDISIQVEKFDATQKDQLYQEKDGYQADIVSSHRVPPLLANILIPGKLGATNEFINALMSFQVLSVNIYQRIWQQALGAAFGTTEAGLGLTPESFLLRKITDLINISQADTVSRMKETPQEAAAEGRDLDKGMKD